MKTQRIGLLSFLSLLAVVALWTNHQPEPEPDVLGPVIKVTHLLSGCYGETKTESKWVLSGDFYNKGEERLTADEIRHLRRVIRQSRHSDDLFGEFEEELDPVAITKLATAQYPWVEALSPRVTLGN